MPIIGLDHVQIAIPRGSEHEDDAKFEGVDRLFGADPFGNRLELRSRLSIS